MLLDPLLVCSPMTWPSTSDSQHLGLCQRQRHRAERAFGRRCAKDGKGTSKVLAVGREAKMMLGRTPGNIVRHPPHEGRRYR